MSKTINKVVCHKLTNITPEFQADFNKSFEAVKLLFNEIVCWGNDSVYGRNHVSGKPEERDLTKDRKKLYKLTDKSITESQFNDILCILYYCVISDGNNGRGLVSSLIGQPQTDETVTDWKEISSIAAEVNAINEEAKKSFREKDDKKGLKIRKQIKNIIKKVVQDKLPHKIGNTLTAIGFKNRKPYNMDIPPAEKYGVVGNVHRMLTSWVECNAMAYSTYIQQENEIDQEFNKFDPSEMESIKDFIDFCGSPVTNDEDSAVIRSFDPRIYSYLKDCLIPCLVVGEKPERQFYLNRKNKKCSFSLHDSFFAYLQSHPALWDSENPLILKSLYLLELDTIHQRHHPYAIYPFMDENSVHRFQYLLGDNYVNYQFEGEGREIIDTVVEVQNFNDVVVHDFTEGIEAQHLFITFKNSRQALPHKLHICIQDSQSYISKKLGRVQKPCSPNNYFKNLKIWTTNNKKCTNLFRFEHKGEEVSAIIKEPAIVFNGEHYDIRLNMTVVVKHDSKVTEALAWYLSSSLPIAKDKRNKTKDSPKNQERFGIIQGQTFKLLGVDLGQRTPYSWAAASCKINGSINKMKVFNEGEFVQELADLGKEYYNCLSDMKSTCRVIGMTKGMKLDLSKKQQISNDGFDKGIIETIRRAQQYFANTEHYNAFTTAKKRAFKKLTESSIEDIYKSLICQVEKIDLIDLKADHNWIGQYLSKYCQLIFKKIKVNRKMHIGKYNSSTSKHDHEFIWLQCIEQLKRVIRASFYMNTNPKNRPEVNMEQLVNYANGVKDNFLKIIASSIVQTALENGCSVIVMEDLDNQRSIETKRQENFMQSLWSVKRIQDAIENAASWHNLAVITVSENCTSQVHYETGKFGYRPKGGLLYYEDSKGVIKSVHADINAAKNILQNAVTRHASIRQVNLNGEFGKRVQGFLTHKFGNVKDGLISLRNKVGAETKYAYLHGKTWITQEQRQAIEDVIKKKNEIKEKSA